MSHYTVIDFLCMDTSPLAVSLQQQINECVQLYGKLLHDIAKNNMAAVRSKLDRFYYELVTDPDDLDELKSVLQVCNISH